MIFSNKGNFKHICVPPQRQLNIRKGRTAWRHHENISKHSDNNQWGWERGRKGEGRRYWKNWKGDDGEGREGEEREGDWKGGWVLSVWFGVIAIWEGIVWRRYASLPRFSFELFLRYSYSFLLFSGKSITSTENVSLLFRLFITRAIYEESLFRSKYV